MGLIDRGKPPALPRDLAGFDLSVGVVPLGDVGSKRSPDEA